MVVSSCCPVTEPTLSLFLLLSLHFQSKYRHCCWVTEPPTGQAMGGVCSSGTSTIQDAKEEVKCKFSGFPGTPNFIRRKEVSLSCPREDESQKARGKCHASESCTLKPSSPAKNGPSKVLNLPVTCRQLLAV